MVDDAQSTDAPDETGEQHGEAEHARVVLGSRDDVFGRLLWTFCSLCAFRGEDGAGSSRLSAPSAA